MFKFPEVKNISNEDKIKMFDMIHYHCDQYGIPLDTIEDADKFWEVLRYGQRMGD